MEFQQVYRNMVHAKLPVQMDGSANILFEVRL